MSLIALVFRILLWPLRRFMNVIFPANELDGLSAAVTAKAAEAFSGYLSKCVPTVQELPWAGMGFAACKNEAAHANSLLLVYLHSPLHRDAEKVGSLLCRDEIRAMLQQMVCLGVSIHTAQGMQLAQLLTAAAYPLLAVLQPSRNNTMELVFKVEGPVLVQMPSVTLAQYLQNGLQRQQTVQAEAEARRMQREQENQLRAEQDAEYQATLDADRERQRQQDEERRRALEAEQAAQDAARQEEEASQNRLATAISLLRDEPTSGDITRIRFQLPTGKKLDRKFSSDETVRVLRAFLTVHFNEHGPDILNIGLSTNFPRKTYNDESDATGSQTLREAGLAPQAVLMVQDLDA